MANSLFSSITKGGLRGIDAPEILFDLIHPYINTGKFYKREGLRERQRELPSFSVEVNEETGERTLYINVYERDYLYYSINFNPFYTEGHYLNGIRKITFLLHPGCHNNSSESILTIYPDIDVIPDQVEYFDITTKLSNTFHSKRSIQRARRVNLKVNMNTNLFKVRIYSEGYINNNHTVQFNQGDVFMAQSIPSAIRYYVDGYGYIEKSGIRFSYFHHNDGFTGEVGINNEDLSYYNRILNVFPDLYTCYIPGGYQIQFSYTNFIHCSGEFLGPDAPDVPFYKNINEKDLLYRILQGKVDSHLPEVREKRLHEYKFFIEKVLPIGVPVTLKGFNGMKKYFGYSVTVLKLKKGTDLETTPYGKNNPINTCDFVKLDTINDDFNKEFDFYTYEDIKPETK